MANERCKFWHTDGEGKKTLHEGEIVEYVGDDQVQVKPDVFGFLLTIPTIDIVSRDGQRTTSP